MAELYNLEVVEAFATAVDEKLLGWMTDEKANAIQPNSPEERVWIGETIGVVAGNLSCLAKVIPSLVNEIRQLQERVLELEYSHTTEEDH